VETCEPITGQAASFDHRSVQLFRLEILDAGFLETAMRSLRDLDATTAASNALAAGVSVFELARIMGTSVAMIERSYGTLIEGAGADIARRLGAFEAEHDRATEAFGPLVGQER
jgi:hypothetical protein